MPEHLYNATEATFKVLEDLDKEAGKTLRWTTQEFGIMYTNMFMVSQNAPLTNKVLKQLVLDKAKDPLAESYHYKLIQKLIERKLK